MRLAWRLCNQAAVDRLYMLNSAALKSVLPPTAYSGSRVPGTRAGLLALAGLDRKADCAKAGGKIGDARSVSAGQAMRDTNVAMRWRFLAQSKGIAVV